VANGVVYVGGAFTSVRPPGDPLGTGGVPRTYLAAFDTGTGSLLSFDPNLNGEVTALASSPGGTTLYVGGSFSEVNGSRQMYLAAFNTATGTQDRAWTPTATGSVYTISPPQTVPPIYLGGNFGRLDGDVRDRAGAVDASGNLLPWAPTLNGSVTSIAVAPDDSRVLIGGYFTTLDGVSQQAIGSTDPTTGASDPWAATIEPNIPGCLADVKDIIIRRNHRLHCVGGHGRRLLRRRLRRQRQYGTLIWQTTASGQPKRSLSSTAGCTRARTLTTAPTRRAGSPRCPILMVAGSPATCSTSRS